MTLLLYGISSGDARPSGTELGVVSRGGLAAIFGDRESGEVDADALARFERVLTDLMDRGTIVPAQFGSVFADEHAISALLEDRHDELLGALRRVRGAVELSVLASVPESALDTSTGTGYMLARLDAVRAAQRIVAHLEPLRELAREARVRVLERPSPTIRGAYLVERELIGPFTALVRHLDEQLEQAALLCTGPWPPYSFVSGSPS